jgi:hypothetical protein
VKSPRFLCVILILANTALFSQNNPAPSVIQLVPVSAKPGSGGFTLTVYGANFAAGSVLRWNGSPRATQVMSSDQLTATINAQDVSKAGTATITVLNPAPGGGTSSAAYFPVQLPSATIALAPDAQRLEAGMIAVGDFNGDGKLDLLIGRGCSGSCDATLDMYAGKGNGVFAAPVRTLIRHLGNGISLYVYSLFVADFNGDGKPDVAFTNGDRFGDDGIGTLILLNNGDGTFAASAVVSDSVAAVADINGDGLLDVVTTGFSPQDIDPEVYVYLAGPGGTYTQTQYFFDIGAAGAALADFNADGKLDLAFASYYCCGVYVAAGNGDGTFQNPVLYGMHNLAHNVFAVDLDGDGRLDLLTDGVCALFGNGDGTFSPGPCTAAAQGPMAIGDFNTDGKVDVAIVAGTPPALNLYFGNGDGTFSGPVVYVLPTPPAYWSVVGLGSGDFSNDGRAGFALSGSSTVAVYEQTVASVTPTALAFGNETAFKTSPPQTVTFANIRSSGLQIRAIKITGSGAFHQTSNCGASLPPGGTCQIQVTFEPKEAGATTAQLLVNCEGSGRQTVPLSGVGISPIP